MQTQSFLSEEEIFEEARALESPSARARFLERQCRGNAVLRRRLEDLLAAEKDADTFFQSCTRAIDLSPPEINLSPPASPSPSASPKTNLSLPAVSLPAEEAIGARIGRYKLLEKIGEGGWGIVYRAEQEEPVRRAVALKIIKLGMETRSVIARFEAERQALALMDHPNIARVYDAGATDRGPPYFVMELVRGVRITQFCDQHRLSQRARLDLFIQVCQAIQHAHQKGIIHGDIKPSNIMVSSQDGTPMPKVIDFGIARATEARLSERFLFTANAQLIGTPAYMSPEQADVTRVDTDTRSDIYSLGVLLYELLTGTTPFDGKALMDLGIDEMRRTLREKEPPRPSARLASLPASELERTAAARRVEPHKLISQVHGDLDWIVMKALEKDRARRYETANGLATDIQRHLANEPVIARPPTRRYRLQKLIRRNRVIFLAGGSVAAALVAGMGTSTWLLLKEREARERAVAAEQQEARLRRDAELRERISQAALLVSQERFEEADRLLDAVPTNQPSVEAAAVLRSVTEWHALRGQWRQAALRGAALLQVNGLDGSDVSALDYLRTGPSFIEIGDTAGYERFRQQAVQRFTSAPCPFADRVVKISLLLPAGDRLLSAMEMLATTTQHHLSEAELSGDLFAAGWRSLSLGLLEYRRGNYTKAVEWTQRSLHYPSANAPRTATARLILSMALLRQGKDTEAHTEWDSAHEVLAAKFHNRLDAGGPVQGFWFDWAFARILLRESAALLGKPTEI